MPEPSAESPVFISYSRKDYYFAESLALHLLKDGITAWLDVKDLNPGVFWERDLFDALDKACCVVIIASGDSMKSPNVRQEMERAISQKKRIIIARFRGSKLADELCECEVVDFRGAFRPALAKLIRHLRAGPPKEAQPRTARLFPKVPGWVAVTVGFLLVPTLAYFALADFISSSTSNVFMSSLTILVALIVAWIVSLSFLQRRMGMTRLAVTLLVFAAIFAAPVVRFLRFGEEGLREESSRFAQATINHWPVVALLAVIPLLGLGMIALFRPYDLLRWTPTGKAWRWYRHRCAARVFRGLNTIPAPQPKPFFLLHDTPDVPAADLIRQSLAKVGWTAVPAQANSTSVLLLTNRTSADWLLQQQSQLTPDVLTLVGTTICLPTQLEWLWKHEWIDLRNWKIERLHSPEPLPAVPEAVTMPRFPGVVRLANHLLCALGALSFCLAAAASPAFMQSQSDVLSDAPPHEVVLILTGLSVAILCFEIARRLLRRTVSERALYRGMWIAWCGAALTAGLAWMNGIPQPALLRIIPAIAFLLLLPVTFLRMRASLAFWFPVAAASPTKTAITLAGKRSWRTFWSAAAFLILWGWLLKAFG
ncbi:MAG TPA: toll/interleukin-1 receptor domain-containing protein [Terriglobales bacterium]|jgi:hypothetical protein